MTFKYVIGRCLYGTLFVLGGLCSKGYAIAQSPMNSCMIEINTPIEGGSVGATSNVRGTAKLPAHTNLWIFAHRKGLAFWWPQGGGPVAIEKGGQWETVVFFGVPRDISSPFEIVGRVVDNNENAALNKWVNEGEKSGQYNGIKLPENLPNCSSNIVTVTKNE